MRRPAALGSVALGLIGLWGIFSIGSGLMWLPGMLLHPPAQAHPSKAAGTIRAHLGAAWTRATVPGGEAVPLDVWHLHRPGSKGVVVYLHGFGDDAWGTLTRAADLPEWDAVGFTFRGRDRNPATPCTLGAWERADVVAVVNHLEASGFPRHRIVLAGWSMGAGTAVLALGDLEVSGGPLGGALLECPFQSLREAARNHIRGTLGSAEPLTRLAQAVALWRASRMAAFEPTSVDALRGVRSLKTPLAFITGDADRITPLEGVQAIAGPSGDLTIVAGAGHCEVSDRLAGGWGTWARARLRRWFPT